MATLAFPVHIVLDDAGAIVLGATVTIASVTDKDGNPVATHGATVSLAGANVVVNYDPTLKGEAWATLAISKAGSTFTGLAAAPRAFLVADAQSVGTLLIRLPQVIPFVSITGEVKADLWRAGAQVAAGDPAADAAAVWASPNRTITDKTGFKLNIDGLDAIATAEPTVAIDGPVATWNFRKLLRWGVMWSSRGDKGLTTITVKTLAGTTSTTQAITSVAGVETLGGPT